jgi:hypothetical protein
MPIGRPEWVREVLDDRERMRREPLPPTIRVKISDVLDADGRVRLSIAYADC